jgi:Taurine catabolism dioxygenase TauD, TfdA family
MLNAERLSGLQMLVDARQSGNSGLIWAEEHQEEVRQHIQMNGVLLIRGIRMAGTAQFAKMLSIFFGCELLEYVYRSTPRTKLRGNIYTATEYPATEVIPQHNENSYSRRWPNRIGFFCVVPPETGGETPIGGSRSVYEMLPQLIRDKFEEKGVMYVRNYSKLDLPWSVVFQTDDKGIVEEYCQANGLEYQWLKHDGLRTSQVNPATVLHPGLNVKVWFNQAHLFHVSSLGKERANTLISSLGEENLPRNSYYGDGSGIEPETLEAIRAAYQETKVKFLWSRNDLLLLDNVRFSHGREAYTGARKVLVGMAASNEPDGPTVMSHSPKEQVVELAKEQWKASK